MAIVVRTWTGAEARALRAARRMSLTDFAAHLGVNPRLLSRWEAGGTAIRPRPVNQAALDTVLNQLAADELARFVEAISPDALSDARDPDVPEQHTTIRHPADGKLMARIPEGIYLAGQQNQPVWLAGYWMDVFPTTNADYARFVAAQDHPAPRHWHGQTPPPELGDHPVVWVSWTDATAYARWACKSLPTAAQWEKAARGTRGNTWPWGNQSTPAKCNIRGSGPGTTTPVATYASGVSPYGVYDMVGNTWEWTATETTTGRYQLKGSAYTSPFDRGEPAGFNDAANTMLDDDTGFRCATEDAAIKMP
ncbi:SUMF1/EgtB/PvdO family nonheme iron enzyme [Nocardia farcinica]|uniref:Serine/threonine-protein kinase pkn1 n=1 Tax=Nocardia farcinica TaxID=37329 RepID=A0A449GJZ8_NOCFR|nr:SUMF1/EgtB/PvdO family nonheme iron enzyme [Nocardia farcinica]MBA4857388.1 SUMF1/EgtB/PvdO family nonheme iron enzyme [Nocardia farcinica]MBC9816910.1 SUMF1/EgtB/PvdO family nonheme iron enzyme [Nocardia farcinica]MBF6071138.1 SUMF1/EgtB/PvdO family nonheme iron enzyme [Nocardia farcinica]MBF6232078.1 SUMF1/EgtB/PvdO family nonheme iron enzyme [Nocardia farcinica]MBF6252904.1 SUMF1/EgtB/PvdO family nonheme iron enzyme [Nocardia farcinica]